MANTRQIKRRISTAQNISKITKAMEMVAASKMKKAQNQALSARAYTQAMAESLRTVSKFVDPALHPLLAQHEEGKSVLVVVSTDKGLCGSLNAHLLKQLLTWKREHSQKSLVVAVGKKAILFTRAMGIPLHAHFTDLPENLTTTDILPLSTLLLEGFLKREFKTVDLLFMDFINTLSQKVKVDQLLPLAKAEIVAADRLSTELHKDYIFEPNPKTILEHLLPFYVENTVYQAFLEARASEHSARMVAMKNASENAAELVDELRLLFNKSRQASITSELLEITTASLALS